MTPDSRAQTPRESREIPTTESGAPGVGAPAGGGMGGYQGQTQNIDDTSTLALMAALRVINKNVDPPLPSNLARISDPLSQMQTQAASQSKSVKAGTFNIDEVERTTKAGNPALFITRVGSDSTYGKGHVQTYLVIRGVVRTSEGNWVIVDDPTDNRGKLKLPESHFDGQQTYYWEN